MGPWYPVMPAKLAPFRAGGDTWARGRGLAGTPDRGRRSLLRPRHDCHPSDAGEAVSGSHRVYRHSWRRDRAPRQDQKAWPEGFSLRDLAERLRSGKTSDRVARILEQRVTRPSGVYLDDSSGICGPDSP